MADETIGKTCDGCKTWKPASEYFTDRRRKYGPSRGLFHRCKACVSSGVKQRRSLDPERFREWERQSSERRFDINRDGKRNRGLPWRLETKFKISIDEFSAILERQNHACAICKNPVIVAPKGRGSREAACLDHNHETGAVRGILCNACNTALGLLGDNAETVQQASEYLRKHEDERLPPPRHCEPGV